MYIPTVRIFNISWGLNHQLKILVELISCHGIRSQCDKRSRVQILTTPHLKWNIQCMCTSTLLSQWALVWGGVLEYITYPEASTISLSFWLNWFLDTDHPQVSPMGKLLHIGVTGNVMRVLYFLVGMTLLYYFIFSGYLDHFTNGWNPEAKF